MSKKTLYLMGSILIVFVCVYFIFFNNSSYEKISMSPSQINNSGENIEPFSGEVITDNSDSFEFVEEDEVLIFYGNDRKETDNIFISK